MKVWSEEHQRWYYSWARVYWWRTCEFFALLWRESPAGGVVTIRCAWECACLRWSERDTHYRFMVKR